MKQITISEIEALLKRQQDQINRTESYDEYDYYNEQHVVSTWQYEISDVVANACFITDPYSSGLFKVGSIVEVDSITFRILQWTGSVYEGSGEGSNKFLVRIISSENPQFNQAAASAGEHKLPVVGWTTGEVISLNYTKTHTEEQVG